MQPPAAKLPPGFSWGGLKLSVYFWRAEDAGYVFDTVVEEEVYTKSSVLLKISHGESLFRTQKRKSIRIKTHKMAYLYILNSVEPSYNIEMNPGHKCIVEDLSDTGCAVTVGGKAEVGMRIKVQFILNNAPVCISGTIRSMEFYEDRNRSLIHIEADPLSIETRNHILSEVFGMQSEEDEELPFRVLDEEASGGAPPEENGASEKDAVNTSAGTDNAL
jgi:c-di-GMP-binding flagellar brake protein YcgR